jgi:hypothetical protein
MELRPYVEDLQERLAVAAGIGGDEAEQLARRLTAPLDAAVRLVLLDALSAAAAEVSAEIAPGSVDLRLRGGDPEFVVVSPAAPPDAAGPSPTLPEPSAAPVDTDAATTRTTLRLPEHLKTQVEVAAAHDGVSVNTWLTRAVAAALDQAGGRSAPRDPRAGTRVTGWVR